MKGSSVQGPGSGGKKGNLRSGFTTGACAAAAAKAALLLVTRHSSLVTEVDIPFPDGSRHTFKIQNSKLKIEENVCVATASVIKDAGDDPDVTNGAEIVAEAKVISEKSEVGSGRSEKVLSSNSHFPLPTSRLFVIKGGKGVGIVTKPGLSVPVGEAAINPVPRQMIREAVMEALTTGSGVQGPGSGRNEEITNLKSLPLAPCPLPLLEITISVPNGEVLAKKTLNDRLGIVGGISILGTTGIVKPVSSEAWTATIISSMDVAKATGRQEIVLSAGRTSEKAHMKRYKLPGECYVLIGDYLEFSLQEAKKHGFGKIHLCAQWAKMVKIAMATPQTHVRFGAIDIRKAVEFLQNLSSEFRVRSPEFNTAREIFEFINMKPETRNSKLFTDVCNAARKYSELITGGVLVSVHLVSYDGDIIADSE